MYNLLGGSGNRRGVRETKVDLSNVAKGTTAATVNIKNRGICDNANVWTSIASGAGVLGKLIFRNIDIDPFTSAKTQSSDVDFNGFLMISCFNTLRLSNVQMRMLLCIGEGLMPFLEDGSFLTKDEARREFIRTFVNEWTEIKAVLRVHMAKIKGDATDSDKDFLDDDLNFKSVNDMVKDATFCMRLLKIWVEFLEESQKRKTASVIVTFLVSMAWRGMVTPARLTKFTTEMDTISPGMSTMCTKDHIGVIWNTFGPRLNDGNVGTIFETWYQLIPPSAIRCRVVLLQAAGSGLTALDVIARAIKTFPAFPWFKIARMYPEEWTAALIAIQTVGTNKWYGFRQDLGPVRSTLYRNITWVGKELLIRSGNDPSLQNKQGWIQSPLHTIMVEQIVADYLASVKPDIDIQTKETDAENDEFRDLLRSVDEYPANQNAPIFQNP